MATIIDVAKLAGVSKTLVSRYLNNVPGVGPENRKKIQAAIKECGYRRNEIARSLVQLKTRSIGVLIDSMETKFHVPLVDGLVQTAMKHDYTVLFGITRSDILLKERLAEYFTHKMVDGVIIYGSNVMDRKIIKKMVDENFPLVLIENDEPNINVDKVLVDNHEAEYKIVKYLIDGGLKDLRYIPWGLNFRAGMKRQAGFVDAMSEAGLLDTNKQLCFADFKERDPIFEDIKTLIHTLRDRDDLPDAFVCGADIVAMDVLVASRKLGLDVPDCFSVAGFDGDDLQLSYFGFPELTTMCQNLREMGTRAVEIMMDRLDNPNKGFETVRFAAMMQKGETVRFDSD